MFKTKSPVTSDLVTETDSISLAESSDGKDEEESKEGSKLSSFSKLRQQNGPQPYNFANPLDNRGDGSSIELPDLDEEEQ